MQKKEAIKVILNIVGFAALLSPAIMMSVIFVVGGPGEYCLDNNSYGEWLPELLFFIYGVAFGLYLIISNKIRVMI